MHRFASLALALALVTLALAAGVAGAGETDPQDAPLAEEVEPAEASGGSAEAPQVAADGPTPDAPIDLPPDRLLLALDLPAGSSFGQVVERWGLPPNAIREAALEHHDLAKVNPGRELALEWIDGEEGARAVRYEVDEDTTLIVRREGEGWVPEVERVSYEVRQAGLVLDIRSSLWEAGISAGLRPLDLTRLARIFEYEVDFNTEIRQGAKLAIVGDLLSTEGRRDKLGTIHAVRLVNGPKTHDLVRFVGDDRKERFYHPDGTSAIRAFLRSPLEFSRVTSGFNPKRYHPILKVPRPHNGTDFGAPTGTPVRTVADGVVTFAGGNGGHGNYVQIKHDDVYQTSYSHLSSVAVKKGQRVRQGELIGRVGSTGMSTGPHLHFQMWKRGRFVDALREEVPRATQLPGHEMAAFRQVVQRWLPQLPETSDVTAEAKPDRR